MIDRPASIYDRVPNESKVNFCGAILSSAPMGATYFLVQEDLHPSAVAPLHVEVWPALGTDSPQCLQFPNDHCDVFSKRALQTLIENVLETQDDQSNGIRTLLAAISADKVKKLKAGGVSI